VLYCPYSTSPETVLLADFSASPVTLLPLISLICSFWLSEFIVLCSGESLLLAVSLAVTFGNIDWLRKWLYGKMNDGNRVWHTFGA